MEITKQMRVRVDLLRNALEAMLNNRLNSHRIVCGIYILAPTGKRKSVDIVYGNKKIASYKDGILEFSAYIPEFWGDEKYKYEILCELAENIGIEVVYKHTIKPNVKSPVKRKTKSKPKN